MNIMKRYILTGVILISGNQNLMAAAASLTKDSGQGESLSGAMPAPAAAALSPRLQALADLQEASKLMSAGDKNGAIEKYKSGLSFLQGLGGSAFRSERVNAHMVLGDAGDGEDGGAAHYRAAIFLSRGRGRYQEALDKLEALRSIGPAAAAASSPDPAAASAAPLPVPLSPYELASSSPVSALSKRRRSNASAASLSPMPGANPLLKATLSEVLGAHMLIGLGAAGLERRRSGVAAGVCAEDTAEPSEFDGGHEAAASAYADPVADAASSAVKKKRRVVRTNASSLYGKTSGSLSPDERSLSAALPRVPAPAEASLLAGSKRTRTFDAEVPLAEGRVEATAAASFRRPTAEELRAIISEHANDPIPLTHDGIMSSMQTIATKYPGLSLNPNEWCGVLYKSQGDEVVHVGNIKDAVRGFVWIPPYVFLD